MMISNVIPLFTCLLRLVLFCTIFKHETPKHNILIGYKQRAMKKLYGLYD